MNKKEIAEQIAALPLRWNKANKLCVLMVTSRDRGRWVFPKGWLMDGKKPWHAAEIEALEEAGAVGSISNRPIGHFHYDKRYEHKDDVHCRVTLYPMIVVKLKRRWKESSERKRHWFSPAKAAKLVEEKELSQFLEDLSVNSEKLEAIEELMKAA